MCAGLLEAVAIDCCPLEVDMSEAVLFTFSVAVAIVCCALVARSEAVLFALLAKSPT